MRGKLSIHPEARRPAPRVLYAATGSTGLDSAEIAQHILDILSDHQAEDLVRIDISKITAFADFFVIATATNVRHMNALIDALDREMKQQYGVDMGPREGTPESGWMLLDFHEVIVHLFSEEQRRFYNLEGLWSRSAPLVRFG